MKRVVYLIILFTCVACQPYPSEVMDALLKAGENKPELIKVLEHYKHSDKKKYKAACFLIGNMPYHQSWDQINLDSAYVNYFLMLDSLHRENPDILNNDSLLTEFACLFDSLPIPQVQEDRQDVEIIKSGDLIDNINQAFERWEQSPLLKDVSFDEFKEWILPYRSSGEALVDDKQLLHKIIYRRLSEKGMDDIRKPINCYKEYVWIQKGLNKKVKSEHHIGPFDLFIPAFIMDCPNLAARTCNYFRACGVPVVCEFTPQWPDKDVGHHWCASPDSNRVLQPYTPPYNNLKEDWDNHLEYSGKVYQQTFGASKESPCSLMKEGEFLPPVFQRPTLKDVTSRYHACTTLTLPLNEDTHTGLAYLCFFHTKGTNLNPVAWGKVNRWKREVVFEQVPLNMLFFAMYYLPDGKMKTICPPFILRSDGTANGFVRKELVCSEDKKEKMHLLRKYPCKRHLVALQEKNNTHFLVGYNHLDGPFDTLLVLKGRLTPYLAEFELKNTRKYRYYRLSVKGLHALNIAEFELLGKKVSTHKCVSPTDIPVLSEQQNLSAHALGLYRIEGTPQKTGPMYLNAYDNDPDTYVESAYLGMDYKMPVCISHIRLMPRNAMNIIEPGLQYKLLYYKDSRWIEHQTQVSAFNYLDFENVPAGTIYWLRNLDKGKEELPFLYKNGKQIFINQ